VTFCPVCKQPYSVRNTERGYSMLCNCGCLILYPSGAHRFISKAEHEENYNDYVLAPNLELRKVTKHFRGLNHV